MRRNRPISGMRVPSGEVNISRGLVLYQRARTNKHGGFIAKRPWVTAVVNLVFLVLATGIGVAETSPPNWSGKYPPCDHHPDLLSREHVDLGVRISTSNAVLARQFARALEFWAGVVDLEWHKVDSQDCAIQLVDGSVELFDAAGTAARAQFPDRPAFQGWIAFNPVSALTEHEMFVVSVHEIGHLLGLPHNPSGSSVMFFFEFDDSVALDAADLNALARRHKLRAAMFGTDGLTAARVAIP